MANQDRHTEELLTSTVREHITSSIEDKGYIVHGIELEIETESEEHFGMLASVVLSISREPSAEESNVSDLNSDIAPVSNVQIERVGTISTQDEVQGDDENRLEEEEIEELKSFLESTYGVRRERITII